LVKTGACPKTCKILIATVANSLRITRLKNMNLFQIPSRLLHGFFLAGLLWFSSPTTLVGGNFQFQVLIVSNAAYTIETSTNLTSWNAVGSNVATNHLITLVDPRGTAGFARQFYRIVLGGSGSQPSYNFGFIEFANAGSFGVSYAPNTIFPVTLNSYSAIFGVEGDTNYLAATNVFLPVPPVRD